MKNTDQMMLILYFAVIVEMVMVLVAAYLGRFGLSFALLVVEIVLVLIILKRIASNKKGVKK